MSLLVASPRSPVGALVSRPAVRVPAEATLAEAAVAMRSASVSSLLVGSAGGIVTERDLVEAMARRLGPDEPVTVVASEDPLVVPYETSVVDAAAAMLNHEVRHLIVAMPDTSPAVISLRDLMGVLIQAVNPGIWLASLRVSLSSSPESWWG